MKTQSCPGIKAESILFLSDMEKCNKEIIQEENAALDEEKIYELLFYDLYDLFT